MIRRRVIPDSDWRIWNTQSLLGEAIAADPARFVEAERLLVEAAKRIDPPAELGEIGAQRVAEARPRLVNLYEAWGKPKEAAKWHAEFETPTNP